MQIVIDIPDKDYNVILANADFYKDKHWGATEVWDAIVGGKVLPKGHGRLIDADDLIQDIIDDNQLCIFNSESERIVHDEMINFAVDRLSDCSTIVEADR